MARKVSIVLLLAACLCFGLSIPATSSAQSEVLTDSYPAANAESMAEVCAAVDAGRPVAVPEDFGETVRAAARQARMDRQIGLIQHWRINAATRNPRQLQKIYAGVIDEAIAAGETNAWEPVDGFDWNNLIAFIERLIPLILQLISLFG